MKSISNRDLKDYFKISLLLIGVFGFTRILLYVIKGSHKKHCP